MRRLGKEAFEKAAALKAALDYDGARKLLKGSDSILRRISKKAPEARKQLAKIEDDAKAKVKEIKDKNRGARSARGGGRNGQSTRRL